VLQHSPQNDEHAFHDKNYEKGLHRVKLSYSYENHVPTQVPARRGKTHLNCIFEDKAPRKKMLP
jgi:hypothetical protein